MSRVPNIFASLVTAAIVAGAMALADAPTWAWLGLGMTVYLCVLPHRARP